MVVVKKGQRMSLRLTSSLILVCGLTMGQAALASLPQNSDLNTQAQDARALQLHNWYEVKGSGVVRVLKAFDDDRKQVSGKGTLTLDNATDFSILEINEKKGTALIDLGEAADGSNEANIYLVNLSDLQGLATQVIDFETVLAEDFLGDDELVATEVARRGGGGARSRRGRGRATYCARDVRTHLRVNIRVPKAAQVYNAYQAHGFRPIGKDWENAPVNTVCGFSGGRRGFGHVAVKLPSGMWKGAGIRAYPYPNRNWQRNYHFQGCVVK
jgi:hypothetical protein